MREFLVHEGVERVRGHCGGAMVRHDAFPGVVASSEVDSATVFKLKVLFVIEVRPDPVLVERGVA
jgi:hypothetical protein